MSSKISNQEIKGTSDWFPEEFAVRKYIFDKWREVCESYGFQEYLSPLLEEANIYRVKSGEDIAGKELMVFKDQGGRELAIRPEMTPSVVRMVSKTYNSSPKPLKLFSIANFIRNEKPQRGRNREFWQLNCDIFGDDGLLSDLEILQLSLDLVLAFNPPKDSFILKINHRSLINILFDKINIATDVRTDLIRLMDKNKKISASDFNSGLEDLGLNSDQIDRILKFISSKDLDDLGDKINEISDSQPLVFLRNIFQKLESLGYGEYCVFAPEVIRGFDYYNGLIFEVFDRHPDNNRAMFGGGRYNGLSSIFGVSDFPATGFAPGDETFKIFLESWGLLTEFSKKQENDLYFLPLLSWDLSEAAFSLAKKLRLEGKKLNLGLSPSKISKALDFANKNKINKIVILGEEELSQGEYKIKDMISGDEESFPL